jgi:ketosteroid isomerase-like protein
MRKRAPITRCLVGLLVVTLLAGCSGLVASPTVSTTQAPSPTHSIEAPRPVVAAGAVQAARAVQPLLERHEAAWATKSVEAIMAFWSDDVHFTDVLGGWRDQPRSTVEDMVRYTMQYWPNVASGHLSYFVDTTGAVYSQDIWDIGDATEADPVHEVDRYETADGLFTELHTTYGVKSLAHITGRPVADFGAMEAVIRGYADSWSSGEASSVAALYAEAASRTDKLWGESAEGRQAISDTAARFFGSYPGAAWRVDTVFGDSGVGGVMTGGIFAVRLAEPDACELGVAVVLETNEAQKIVAERVFWELDSLVRCRFA